MEQAWMPWKFGKVAEDSEKLYKQFYLSTEVMVTDMAVFRSDLVSAAMDSSTEHDLNETLRKIALEREIQTMTAIQAVLRDTVLEMAPAMPKLLWLKYVSLANELTLAGLLDFIHAVSVHFGGITPTTETESRLLIKALEDEDERISPGRKRSPQSPPMPRPGKRRRSGSVTKSSRTAKAECSPLKPRRRSARIKKRHESSQPADAAAAECDKMG